ncbi:MAG TPA: hypothetical protein PKA63_12570 [Oligoflexia bacterium]|nr:hypothetical protein [Oligoflexia bacterium]HMP49491.1 hypothetical protein [Oligoflexia bacterium]
MDVISAFKRNASIFRLSGSDAERYLHGRSTQDIKSMVSGGEPRWALILTPQGKIESAFYVLKVADNDFLLVCEKRASQDSFEEDFMKSLLRFKVADQVVCEDVSLQNGLLSVSGIPEDSLIFSNARTLRQEQENTSSSLFLFPVWRGNFCFLDIIYELSQDLSVMDQFSSKLASSSLEFELRESTPEYYELLRVRAGHPVFNQDITQAIFAPDLPAKKYISFGKGCYAGQEVVEMAKARGKPNRVFAQFKADAPVSEISGNEISSREIFAVIDGEEIKAGFITSAVDDYEYGDLIALGFLKNTVLEKLGLKNDSLFVKGEDRIIPIFISSVFNDESL